MASRVTEPEKPFSEVMLMVDVVVLVPVAGAVRVAEDGLADKEKSGPVTSTKTSAKRDNEPLVPMMLMK